MDLKNCYLFSYDDDDDDDQISGNFKDNLVKLDLDFDIQEDDLELTGSCNGLISLGSMFNLNPASNEYFIIWNPATRKLCKYASFGYLEPFNNEHCFFVAPGFGYVSSIDDYKYVRILTVLWDIGGGDYDGVMGGCLSKCNCDKTFAGDKVMRILESPAIVKSIGLPKGLRLDTKSEMIGFTRTGKFFVTGPFNDEPRDFHIRTLGIVDTRTKPMQYTMLLRFDHFFRMARYVPSLVSPIPIEEPSEA
ncbi:uncharacterized protein LOC141606027 isoform X3 [Silene latifolia]|uniref:uncharacterized protein LOC141606027 isoform X3 n=1 Tax=Silene latifolia TaxID=37657 RepID=UPI003D78949C